MRSPTRKWMAAAVVLIAVAGAVAALVWWKGAGNVAGLSSDGVWTCSMHPQVRLNGPGKCPICGMNLIPLSRLGDEQKQIEERAGLETKEVRRRELFKELRTVGKIDYSEARVAEIAARIAGRVDRVYADFTGVEVQRGDHLVDIYSPELLVTVQNLLDAKRTGNASYLADARTRLELLGIEADQIDDMLARGTGETHIVIRSPIGGIVTEKNIREGQYVDEGDLLYRIAELDPIWLYLDIYEYDLAWIRYGQPCEVALEAYPGQVFHGTVVFIDPFLDDTTRTVKVRINLPNPDRRLKPAMYASATLRVRLRNDGTPEPTGYEGKYTCPMHPDIVQDTAGRCPQCNMPLERVPELPPVAGEHDLHAAPHGEHTDSGVLAVPASAILDTGLRRIVYRRTDDGAYELVDVQLGPLAEAEDAQGQRAKYYLVLAGLVEGDQVVARGGFLLDSERQIQGMPSLLYAEGRSAAQLHAGHGGAAPSSVSGSEHEGHAPASEPPASGATGHKHP